LRRFIFSFIVIIFAFSACGFAAAKTTTEKAKAVLQYYVKNTRGIILKGDDKIIKGRIRGFRGKGIVFDPAKSGPFYNPKPQYYPMSRVQAFVDAGGKVLWGHTTVKPKQDYLKIRRYRFMFGGQYGIGKHTRSYIFEPIAPEDYDYVQELQAGNNLVGKVAVFLAPKLSLGAKYIRHNTVAEIYGLQGTGDGAHEGTIKDDIVIQSIMFDFGLHHAVNRLVLIHADLAAGLLTYHADRRQNDGKVTITSSSFCAMPSVGIDFLLHRNAAVSFDVGYLFGAVKEPKVSNESQIFTGQQSMERFDVNVGLTFFF